MVAQKKASRTKSLTRFTVGGRTYRPVPILEEGESSVTGNTMVKRARELNANLGKKDGQFILVNQAEIPKEFRGKFFLVFTAWRHPSHPQSIAYLHWDGNRWYRGWGWLGDVWNEYDRLVRCVK